MPRRIRPRAPGFEQGYAAKYGGPPPPLADLAFDAASIARVLGGEGRFSIASLTQEAGFLGADGWLALLSDGQVRRGLAVFRVERGGPQIRSRRRNRRRAPVGDRHVRFPLPLAGQDG